jgi:catechol 2,3-dioxygenase-like lactoylglutathione lyase family enzyme
MITKVNIVGAYVSDQQRALDFYTQKLGMELRTDQPMGPDQRWIEVGPTGHDTNIVLYTPEGQEDRIGTFAAFTLSCSDIMATYDDLKAKGVEFVQPPEMQPWGLMMAILKDQDGNSIVMTQPSSGATKA